MVEAKHSISGLLVAATVHDPEEMEVWMRVWSTSLQAIQLPAGKIIGLFSPVEEETQPSGQTSTVSKDGTTFYRVEADQRPDLLPHLKELAEGWCKELGEGKTPAADKLPRKYEDLLSTGPLAVRQANRVKHNINLKPRSKSVKQRVYRHQPGLIVCMEDVLETLPDPAYSHPTAPLETSPH